MKRIFALLCLAFMLAVFTGIAIAHSGGTDKYGCHVDHKTGIRH